LKQDYNVIPLLLEKKFNMIEASIFIYSPFYIMKNCCSSCHAGVMLRLAFGLSLALVGLAHYMTIGYKSLR